MFMKEYLQILCLTPRYTIHYSMVIEVTNWSIRDIEREI